MKLYSKPISKGAEVVELNNHLISYLSSFIEVIAWGKQESIA